MNDPTIEEMRQALRDADEWDREAAIYWFASDYHSEANGQTSMPPCVGASIGPGPSSSDP